MHPICQTDTLRPRCIDWEYTSVYLMDWRVYLGIPKVGKVQVLGSQHDTEGTSTDLLITHVWCSSYCINLESSFMFFHFKTLPIHHYLCKVLTNNIEKKSHTLPQAALGQCGNGKGKAQWQYMFHAEISTELCKLPGGDLNQSRSRRGILKWGMYQFMDWLRSKS
jgi:hypothetical protein